MTLAHFPADRRLADIRRCAQALLNLHGEAANTYWRAQMAEFAAGLARQGASSEAIAQQADLFMSAVQNELQRLFLEEVDQAMDARA